ncbi:hypothetical protein AAK894_12775 [Lachnospiraceae bacterium 46-61]
MSINIKKILSLFCCALLSFLFVLPTNITFASSSNELDVLLNTILEYSTVYEDGRFIFNEETAKANGESEEIIEIGKKVEELSMGYYQLKMGIEPYNGLPFYGNWCGPKHTGHGDPIDYLDKQCKIHDECYADNGYFNCDCDKELVEAIDRKYDDMSGSQKEMAAAIRLYFKGQMFAHGC